MPAAEINVLTGLDDSNLDYTLYPSGLHRGAVAAFGRLQQAASSAGYDMAIASSFRSFDRQLLIWNEKAAGRRPLYGEQGQTLVFEQLSPWQLAQAILRWSALPGASRHHWGTDLDIYDRAAVSADYQLQLTPAEVTGEGPFTPLHDWLDQQFQNGHGEGFFRPYDCDRGGVAPERWHLSYAPLAIDYQQQLSLDRLTEFLGPQQLALKELVLEHIEEIYHRYIKVPADAYPRGYSSGG